MSPTRAKTADEIAAMFLERATWTPDGKQGGVALTVKQAKWLMDVAHREDMRGYEQACRRSGHSVPPPSTRETTGNHALGYWVLHIMRNGSGNLILWRTRESA